MLKLKSAVTAGILFIAVGAFASNFRVAGRQKERRRSKIGGTPMNGRVVLFGVNEKMRFCPTHTLRRQRAR